MAINETIGTLVTKLALDMKEFEVSIQKAEGLSKAMKMSLKDLGSLSIDPAGKLSKSLEDVSVKTDVAAKSTREFFREQRMQDRVFRESVQSISSMAFALAFLTQGFGNAEGATKRLVSSLVAGVGAANAAEFALFGLGKAGEQMGGKLGGALVKIGNMAGPISIVIGLLTSVVQYVRETEAELDRLGSSIVARRLRLAGGAPLQKQLLDARKELEAAKKAQDEAVASMGKRMAAQDVILSTGIPGAAGIAGLIGSGQTSALAAIDRYLAALEKEQTIVSLMYDKRISKEDQLDRLRDMAAKREEERRRKGLTGPPELYGPEKPAYIDQEFEAGERAFRQQSERWMRFQDELADKKLRIEEQIAQAREQQWEKDLAAAQNLGNVILSSFNIAGDSLAGKLIRAAQYLVQLIGAINANTGSVGGVLGVISSVLPFLGLLGAPSTGIGETVIETNRASGGGSPVIRMVGRVDVSNGQVFLIQEMPGYENYRNKKAI